jgi:hypothetical protein
MPRINKGYVAWPDPVISTVSVGSTSTQIVAENKKLVELHLVNKGIVEVWVNFGSAAEVGKGTLIPPNNGVLKVLVDEMIDEFVLKNVYGIVSSGTADVAIFSQSTP